jgi:hypothetical protein
MFLGDGILSTRLRVLFFALSFVLVMPLRGAGK